MKKISILFIHNSSSYVKTDLDILKKHFIVAVYKFNSSKNTSKMLWEYLKFFFFLIKNIRKFDMYFIWFADYHSFPPILISKIFNKKAIINLGGYDVTYIPKLNYGAFSNPLRSFVTKFSIKNASLNLAVSENIKQEALQRINKANIKVIHTGYDTNSLGISEKTKKKKIVLTTSKADNYARFKIKGLDFFCEVAKQLPDYQFIAVGVQKNLEKYFKNKPKNLTSYPILSQTKLSEFYQSAKVYAQFSLREGFPSSICEAMLFEEIPVSTDVGAAKEIIGDTGFVLENKEISLAVETIKKAMNLPDSEGKKCRNRIIENFNLEIREKKLLTEIKKLLDIT